MMVVVVWDKYIDISWDLEYVQHQVCHSCLEYQNPTYLENCFNVDSNKNALYAYIIDSFGDAAIPLGKLLDVINGRCVSASRQNVEVLQPGNHEEAE